MQNDNRQYAALLLELAKNQTVLVAEDDPTANLLAVTFLQKFYSRVDSAENGQIALEMYKKDSYDIVVTDINMPKMSGLELGRNIRAINSEQKIVIMTAHNDTSFMQDAIRIGVNEYMFKPMDYADFLVVLYRISKQIENEKLLQEQSKLAALGEMISMIAHQWRQPLSVLQLILDNIQFDFKSKTLSLEELITQTSEAKQQINFMSKTIDDFRYFFHQGEQNLFSAMDAVSTAAALCEAQLETYDILLSVSGEDVLILGNKNQLTHVILALIHNSKDAILEKKLTNGTININLSVQDNALTISTKDNGIGLNNSLVNKIFEPHFTTKPKAISSGIGLHIAKTIVNRNFNGTIKADTIPSGGFEVIVCLPMK
ncbi:MAG: hypothetical protein RL154_716 [Pseudomonadota bacterium]|jgi:YesN/AraC family two-component response regulator